MPIAVAHNSNVTEGASVTSVTSSPTFASTTGNLLILGAVGDSVSGEGATPVSDGLNTWVTSKQANVGPDPTWLNMAYAKNITGQSSQSATYTLSGAGYPTVCLLEVSGCDTASPVDVAPAYQGAASNNPGIISSSLITPTAGQRLIVVFGSTAIGGSPAQTVTNTGTATPTWTTIVNNSTTGMSALMAYTIVTATGSQTYGVSYSNGISGATTCVVGIAAFKVQAAPQVVHASNAIQAHSATSVTSSPTFASTAGNLLIVGTVDYFGADVTTPITNVGGDTWTRSGSQSIVGNQSTGMLYADSIHGNAAEAATYTISAAQFPAVVLLEASGCAATTPNDTAATYASGGGASTLNSPLITPASGTHLLVVVAQNDTGSGTINQTVSNNGTGAATWTVVQNNSSTGEPILVAYAVVTANGSSTYGVTYNAGVTSNMVVGIASFVAAGGGGGGPASYPITVSTTKTQSVALGKQANLTRALTEAQSLALQKQVALTRAITEAQSITVVAQKVFLRTVSLIQAQAVTLLKQLRLIRSDTQTQAVSIRQALARTLGVTQSQALALLKQARLVRALAQTQSLSIVAQKVFLRTVSAIQAQLVSLIATGRHTYTLTVTTTSHQAASVTYTVIPFTAGAPPIPVAVASVPPLSGTSTSNYLDWPELIIEPTWPAPPVGNAVGGP